MYSISPGFCLFVFLQLPTCLSNFLLAISNWIYNRHLKCKLSKTKLLIIPRTEFLLVMVPPSNWLLGPKIQELPLFFPFYHLTQALLLTLPLICTLDKPTHFHISCHSTNISVCFLSLVLLILIVWTR